MYVHNTIPSTQLRKAPEVKCVCNAWPLNIQFLSWIRIPVGIKFLRIFAHTQTIVFIWKRCHLLTSSCVHGMCSHNDSSSRHVTSIVYAFASVKCTAVSNGAQWISCKLTVDEIAFISNSLFLCLKFTRRVTIASRITHYDDRWWNMVRLRLWWAHDIAIETHNQFGRKRKQKTFLSGARGQWVGARIESKWKSANHGD